MKAVVLQISDIHLDHTRTNPVLPRAKAIAHSLYSHIPDASAVFIVVSGDIAQSGKIEQYKIATTFLREIEAELRTEFAGEINFVFAPGNHDCDFDLDNGARKGSVRLVEDGPMSDVDTSVIESCTSIQHEFFAFRDQFEGVGWKGDDLWRTQTFSLGSAAIKFETFNISWVSKMREQPGKLHFPFLRYENQPKGECEVSVAVMHHPLNWFSQAIYRDFRRFIRTRATIVVTGHEHQAGISEIDELESGKSICLEGCVLQDSKGLIGTGFNVVTIDLASKQYQVSHYLLDGATYISGGMGSWADYRPLPIKKSNPFEISDLFRRVLDDPGAYLSLGGRDNVQLPDIYVYPDLTKLNTETSGQRRYINSTILLSPDVLTPGVLIEGEEKSGCSSLLYQIFREYHERGFVPVYIKGDDLKRTTSQDIDGVVRRAVLSQYGESAVTRFSSISKSEKILLVDDFDESPMRAAAARAEIISVLKSRFNRMVITVGPMFEMKELFSNDADEDALKSLDRYRLQPFGNVRRAQLIRKWFEIGHDGSLDDATLLGKCDAVEKLMNGVMNKSLIPHIPLHLLTLLQSVEVGRSGELKDSALGHYYQFLLTSALQRAGVKPDKLNEYYHYCAHLAWEYHILGETSLGKTELIRFNKAYSDIWHTVDLESKLTLLEEARVLSRVDDSFSFRYPYLYYFLKGYYISSYIDEAGMRDYITLCCNHLYVRDNANTILFLAHHASGDFVYSQISFALEKLFEDQDPAEFNGDTSAISELIANAPHLTYKGGAPERHREERNRTRDEDDDGRDGLLDKQESTEKLSLSAQLVMLSKTSEILGQVLKDQYAKIPRTRKGELIEGIFDGSLRALSDFYHLINSHSDRLIIEIKARLEEKGKTIKDRGGESLARLVVADLVQGVSFGLVLRAAQNAGSDDLREDISAAVKKRNTMAYRVLELATYLDAARPLPRRLIETVHNEGKSNIVVGRLLTMLVLNRLYMFKTTESDMQWLSSKLSLKMEVQHAITYQREDAKRVH